MTETGRDRRVVLEHEVPVMYFLTWSGSIKYAKVVQYSMQINSQPKFRFWPFAAISNAEIHAR